MTQPTDDRPVAMMSMPGRWPAADALRAGLVLGAFGLVTLAGLPVQWVLLRMSNRGARWFPHWYHKLVCRLLGVRHQIDGAVSRDRPVLLVANHVSWLDIPVLSAVAPVSFVAKREVGTWPGVSILAHLQRTVFVDRERRSAVGAVAQEMGRRLADGDTLVLFAEGTSTDGNRVLPFMSSLFAAATQMDGVSEEALDIHVQTLSLVYTHLHGVPLGRDDRTMIGWYGDMDMAPHAWQLLKAGPLDVRVVLGEPRPISDFVDRKDLARRAEDDVRGTVVAVLRGRDV